MRQIDEVANTAQSNAAPDDTLLAGDMGAEKESAGSKPEERGKNESPSPIANMTLMLKAFNKRLTLTDAFVDKSLEACSKMLLGEEVEADRLIEAVSDFWAAMTADTPGFLPYNSLVKTMVEPLKGNTGKALIHYSVRQGSHVNRFFREANEDARLLCLDMMKGRMPEPNGFFQRTTDAFCDLVRFSMTYHGCIAGPEA